MQTSLFALTCALWLTGALGAAVSGRKASDGFFSALLCAGGITGLACAYFSWGQEAIWYAPYPLYLGVAPFQLHLDSLSAVFIALLSSVAASISFFSPGYLAHLNKHSGTSFYWVFFFLFIVSMLMVVSAFNAITFIVFWEIMSLSSAALVATDFTNTRSQKATLVYLGATRVATAFLAAGFIAFHAHTHSWLFVHWNMFDAGSIVPAILILTGLLIKAGIWPFHIWLPYAHPAAPSPVSALMSGVMLKVAIYAVIRLFFMSDSGSIAFALLLLFFGAVSTVWGILFALAQKDMKTLLAYSSIENIGIIVMALALSMYGRALGHPELAAIGLAAAILHCVNHGLFKSLLFLGVGAVDTAAHTRSLSLLGGLGQRMPLTLICFLIGCASMKTAESESRCS